MNMDDILFYIGGVFFLVGFIIQFMLRYNVSIDKVREIENPKDLSLTG